MRKISGTTPPRDALRQGRSTTPSSSGSNWSLNRARRSVMTGLQDAVQEWKNAPPASTLPQPLFASSSSIRLEEGMRQMSEVVAKMSETVMKIDSMDSLFLLFLFPLHIWTYHSNLFLMDYLSYPCFLTNFTPRKGDQGRPSMRLLAVSQPEQVYGTIYVY